MIHWERETRQEWDKDAGFPFGPLSVSSNNPMDKCISYLVFDLDITHNGSSTAV